jgi:hypothetical protein
LNSQKHNLVFSELRMREAAAAAAIYHIAGAVSLALDATVFIFQRQFLFSKTTRGGSE